MHLSETVKHAFVNFDLMPTLFEKIVDLPHLLMRFFVLVAYLQILYDDPGFAPILAGQKARRKREHDLSHSESCGQSQEVPAAVDIEY